MRCRSLVEPVETSAARLVEPFEDRPTHLVLTSHCLGPRQRAVDGPPARGHRGVVQTGGVQIEIGADGIRLGQLLKFANVVADGAEAKVLIASGEVQVDGRIETRRGRQVAVGSVVLVNLLEGERELRVVR